MATLTLRNTKGSALTFTELDSNFQALDSDAVRISGNQTISGIKTFNDSVVIKGLTFPVSDGSADQFLTTNGSGILSFATVTSYDSAKVQGQIDSAAVGLTGNDTINGIKTFQDSVVIKGLTYPVADGNANQFLTTNGSGILSFATVESYDSAKVQGQIDSNAPTFLSSGANDNYTSGTLTFDNGTTLTAANGATVNFNMADGTAPFVVTSTTKVANLNVEKVDGFNGIGIYDSAGSLLNG